MRYAIEPFSILSDLAGSSLEKPLLAEPGAEVLEACKVADQAEAVLAAISADVLLSWHHSLLQPEEVCSGAKTLKSAAAMIVSTSRGYKIGAYG
jgi:hypothetical protein